MKLLRPLRSAPLVALFGALLVSAPLPAFAQAPAGKAAGQYAVGDRLAAPAAGKGEFREISWDDLIPADWNPEGFLSSLELDKLEDNDPRAAEALQLSNRQVNWAHLQALAWAESLDSE